MLCFSKKTSRRTGTLKGFWGLDFGNFDLDLAAQLSGLADAVDDGLIVQDLAGGHGSAAVAVDGIQEGADLLVKQLAIRGNDRDLGHGLRASHVGVQLHGAAHGAVPALGGGDTQGSLLAEDDGVTGSVQMHGL